MDYWPFEDADELSDDLWSLVDVRNAQSPAELNFLRVLSFHGDFLNGGFLQVMYNLKEARRENIADYIASFEAMGLAPFATVIALAEQQVDVGEGWRSVFGKRPAGLDKVYKAMALGLPMAEQDRFDEFLAADDDGFYVCVDWVAKAALKYARDNISEFGNLVALSRPERSDE